MAAQPLCSPTFGSELIPTWNKNLEGNALKLRFTFRMDFNVWQRVLIREALEKALRSQAYLLQFRYRHLFFFSSLEDLTLLDSDHLLHSQCRWMKKVFSFCKPTGTDRKSLMHTDILFPGSISTQFASQGIASDRLSTVSSLRSNKSQWPSNMLYLCFLLVAWPLSNWNLCHFLGIWLLVYRIYIRMHVAKDITKTQISQWCVNMGLLPFHTTGSRVLVAMAAPQCWGSLLSSVSTCLNT